MIKMSAIDSNVINDEMFKYKEEQKFILQGAACSH